MKKLKSYFDILLEIVNKWSDDKAPKLGAALSYYTVFSLAPLLVITIAVVGIIFGQDAAQGKIVEEIQSLVGKEGATVIQTAIKNSSNLESGIIATVIGFVTLIISATVTFVELQDSLNMIWKVKSKPGQAILEFLRTRLISFSMIVAIGFLLLVSLLVSTAIRALSNYMGEFLSFPIPLIAILNFLLSMFIIFVMFSLIYKVLPDVNLSWKDVRMGALVTTILFVIGKYLIGLYLGSSTIGSTYGAAGSLAIVLVWIYYSSQILFLGAEFTYVYATKFGSGIKPSPHAVKVDTVEKEKKNYAF